MNLIKKGILCTLLFLPLHTFTASEIPRVSNMVSQEIKCMELNLYHEARGESLKGIRAVAAVTINRKNSGKFPSTVCGVVKQPGQFSWVKTKGFTRVVIPNYIRQIAFEAVTSKHWYDVTHGALFFHNEQVEKFDRKMKVKIGPHYFYA